MKDERGPFHLVFLPFCLIKMGWVIAYIDPDSYEFYVMNWDDYEKANIKTFVLDKNIQKKIFIHFYANTYHLTVISLMKSPNAYEEFDIPEDEIPYDARIILIDTGDNKVRGYVDTRERFYGWSNQDGGMIETGWGR